jgi:hypothetical protein
MWSGSGLSTPPCLAEGKDSKRYLLPRGKEDGPSLAAPSDGLTSIHFGFIVFIFQSRLLLLCPLRSGGQSVTREVCSADEGTCNPAHNYPIVCSWSSELYRCSFVTGRSTHRKTGRQNLWWCWSELFSFIWVLRRFNWEFLPNTPSFWFGSQRKELIFTKIYHGWKNQWPNLLQQTTSIIGMALLQFFRSFLV